MFLVKEGKKVLWGHFHITGGERRKRRTAIAIFVFCHTGHLDSKGEKAR